MKATIDINGHQIKTDLSKGIEISIPLRYGEKNPNAWYAPYPDFTPVEADGFIGSVARGGSVNFYNVKLNPHGNGTHTECVGHISPEHQSINGLLKNYFSLAHLISVFPEKLENGDRIITKSQLQDISLEEVQSVIIRTLPNDDSKLTRQYSHTNPPYLDHELLKYLREQNILHLLIDLPSVDREEDEGKLLGHRAFWNYPDAPRLGATITEMIYVPEDVKDGKYLLSLQIPPFELDAAPSRPVLYPIF